MIDTFEIERRYNAFQSAVKDYYEQMHDPQLREIAKRICCLRNEDPEELICYLEMPVADHRRNYPPSWQHVMPRWATRIGDAIAAREVINSVPRATTDEA